MAVFMPKDSENLNETVLLGALAPMVNTVENFVNFYNSGLINRNNDDVSAIADNVVEAFKNLEKKSGKIVFLSEDEVKLEEISEKLTPWLGLVILRRVVEEGLSEGIITEASDVILDDSGAINFGIDDENDSKTGKLSNDRLKKEVYTAITDQYGSVLTVKQILELDSSFISEIYDLL